LQRINALAPSLGARKHHELFACLLRADIWLALLGALRQN